MASAAGLTTAQTWISGLGDAASFVLLISPVCTFLRVKRTGLIGNVDVMPFIFTFFNCLMLVANAIPDLDHSKPILIINILGSFLELIWIALFIYYSDGTKRAVAIGSLIVTTVSLVFTKVKQHKWSPTFLGYLAAISGVAMYTLPIRSTCKMVRLKDGGDLNLMMILASLANGGLWSAFAKVGRRSVNWFLMVPNATAILCASGQLIVWVYLFMNKPPVLPVVAPAQNQGGAALPAQNQEGAVGLQQGEGEGSRAGENLSQRQQPEGLRAGPSPGALASSSAVVTDLEMAIRSGSPDRSKPGSGSGASSKSVSDALSRSVSRSPTRSGTLTQSKPGSPSGSRSPTRSATRSPSGSHSPTRSATRSKSGSPSGSQSGSRAPSKPVSPSVPRSPSSSSSASDTQQPLVPPSSLHTPSPSPAETHDDNTD